MNVVILAAGKGTRMRSQRPKVLQPLAGRPLLTHVLQTTKSVANSSPIVVVGYGAGIVRAHYDARLTDTPQLRYALQSEQLGTGHAVQQALPMLEGDGQTLILYGDVPLTRVETLQALLDAAGTEAVGLLTVNLPDPTGYGRIVRNAEGCVQRIVEHKDATADERAIHEVNTGILAVPTPLLRNWLGKLKNHNAQGEYYLTDIIGMAVAEGVAVNTVQPAFAWEVEGVNDRRQLAALERTWQRVQADRLLEAGVTLVDPARIDIRGSLICGRDVLIDVNCVFEGTVELADDVQIGPNCVLRDVRVAAGARIEAFSHLAEAQLGERSDVGPFARLRPGSVLGAGAHVGNFVEMKKATLGDGSKAGHLSYLGDATIGRNVNIGAGTITCNYDGANKHQTIIEDDVFIGSDSALVAPVTVKRGATLGASTTLTKDAPEGKLTISRAKQTTVEGWTRPVKKPKG
ncbi:bifunctional N-acetylglucosamine-1-phosphate uridyltransferase/glucosamine-1-phosphate acetyltransferase [beta proteobacterium AAP99]|nr:bifunctional N-acetylglucosamine-1-phosphate uridyltransferase/glucosamine-1-phosphate acetyltransferase [beta proteobacterium AAP99]